MNINHHWYGPKKTWLSWLLAPMSFLFYVLMNLRRLLYRCGFKKITHFKVPVIVVGNITVGGTGKTPFVIWLANFLREKGYQPGIVSRGVGGQQQQAPRKVSIDSDATKVGDEAILLASRSGCPVVIGIDRVQAVAKLINEDNCNVIISDDGLQHYRLGRHIEIAIVDGVRRFGNELLLPAGPLREPVQRLQEVDFIVAQQQAEPHENLMLLEGKELVSINQPESIIDIASLKDTRVHAVAAIGNPTRFFAVLKNWGLDVIEHIFPDHYLLQKDDVCFADDLAVIMTEKDAVKCRGFANRQHWFLPVKVKLDEKFKLNLLEKLKEVAR